MTKSLLSNVQLFPELSQAIQEFARRKKIKFETAIIELLMIGLEEANSNNSEIRESTNEIFNNEEIVDLEKFISNLTTTLIRNSNLNVDPEVIKQLTIEIVKSQVDNNDITHEMPENNINNIWESYYVQIPNFLNFSEKEKLIEYSLANKEKFVATSTATEIDNYRQSKVLYSLAEFQQIITNKIDYILPKILTKLQITEFYPTEIESQITAHNDGNFYKIHNDNGSPETMNRVLTYVYYFYQEPKAFSGGELKIYDSKLENNYYVAADSYKTVEPINNSIIFFLSRYMHEVLPVKCPSQDFAHSRFTVNGWIRQ